MEILGKKDSIASLSRAVSIFIMIAVSSSSFGDQAPTLNIEDFSDLSISANPAAVNVNPGNGDLGHLFNLSDDSGIRLGGSWIANGNWLFSGGESSRDLTGNNSIILGLTLDTQKLSLWKGGLFGVQMLQFNGMSSNEDAGTVQGYNSLTGPPPLNRTELYQLWYRQSFLDNKFNFRVGKTVPTYNFNNVLRPVPVSDENLVIPSVSGLLFTPVFVNSTLLGVLPGYYNSSYGITSTIAPNKHFYLSTGAYDGNLANGSQTGLEGPHLNGYYFLIGETGVAWEAGATKKPGIFALGGWDQTGELTASNAITENGMQGLYIFASQRLWYHHPGEDISGMSGYFQLGINNSQTLSTKKYAGAGLTFFALTRPKDSFGVGLASGWLNPNVTARKNELMLQGYYQAHIARGTYLEPTLTYIPTPGAAADLPETWVGTLQIIKLF